MFSPKEVVVLDTDPLADRGSRTGVVVAESGYDDWVGTARYNVVCLTTDFEEYGDHDHTYTLDRDEHTAFGALREHSLVCPWASVALPGSSLTHVSGGELHDEKVSLTDEGHEIVSGAVYEFFSSHNDY